MSGAAAPEVGHAEGPWDQRTVELAERLAGVRQRIADACASAGRSVEEVSIVAITKTWPAADVRRLTSLGLREMGENRERELTQKATDCADLDIVWHFVGQLQRNKARAVAEHAQVVESVDRLPLIEALDRGASHAQRRIGVCLQVDLDDAERPGRGGTRPEGLGTLAAAVEEASMLDLLGVMAVAPRQMDSARAFDRLAAAHERLLSDHPAATMRSAGMSGDLAEAISAGATHVRLGSALLGRRDPLK